MPKQSNTTPLATEVYRTAESVSPKHPDKLCDQISDAIVDAYLRGDPDARVAVDVAGGHGTIFITGEVRSKVSQVPLRAIVDRIVGLTVQKEPYEIIERLVTQSPEIAQGVDTGGAGDQGIMIGYATSETPEYLPLEYVLARDLNQYLYAIWPYDGKTQVTLRGSRIEAIVASFQHAPRAELTEAVKEWGRSQHYVSKVFVKYQSNNPTLHINPAGDWDIGGFDADAGLTGRKLAVDSYGPRIPVGGGAFSGKDGTKVDRSGAYIARQLAVEYLQQYQAHEVYVHLAYAIGYPYPVEATATIDGRQQAITDIDLTPSAIIQRLGLNKPELEARARYGHF